MINQNVNVGQYLDLLASKRVRVRELFNKLYVRGKMPLSHGTYLFCDLEKEEYVIYDENKLYHDDKYFWLPSMAQMINILEMECSGYFEPIIKHGRYIIRMNNYDRDLCVTMFEYETDTSDLCEALWKAITIGFDYRGAVINQSTKG